MHRPEVSIVVPLYNEEHNIRPLCEQIIESCAGLDFELLLINDASQDGTRLKIDELEKNYSFIHAIHFLANAGHQSALRAGLRHSQGNWIVTMDGDLQHPPKWIPEMLRQAKAGQYEVIQMLRENRQQGVFKNFFSGIFYWLFNKTADFKIYPNSSDFRLISRSVADIINALPERGLFLRGIIPLLGFKTGNINYQANERHSGKTNYSFMKSAHLASSAIFGFSTLPLRWAYRLGITISSLAFMYGFFSVLTRIFTNWNVPGYTDIVASVLFLNGIIILFVGLLGRYLIIILEQIRGRPEYILDSSTNRNKHTYEKYVSPDMSISQSDWGSVSSVNKIPNPIHSSSVTATANTEIKASQNIESKLKLNP